MNYFPEQYQLICLSVMQGLNFKILLRLNCASEGYTAGPKGHRNGILN
jgi:hypothetical protein